MKTYQRPVLVYVSATVGVLTILAALIIMGIILSLRQQPLFIEAFQPAAPIFAIGLFFLGAAGIYHHVAYTSHWAEISAELLKTISSQNSVRASMQPAEPEHAPQIYVPPLEAFSKHGFPRGKLIHTAYFYGVEGKAVGPVGMKDIKDLKLRGVINDSTPVFREGDKEWKTLSDFRQVIG